MSESMRAILFTSPMGRGRREAPGEGVQSIEIPYSLTPALSPWEREHTSVAARGADELWPLVASR